MLTHKCHQSPCGELAGRKPSTGRSRVKFNFEKEEKEKRGVPKYALLWPSANCNVNLASGMSKKEGCLRIPDKAAIPQLQQAVAPTVGPSSLQNSRVQHRSAHCHILTMCTEPSTSLCCPQRILRGKARAHMQGSLQCVPPSPCPRLW